MIRLASGTPIAPLEHTLLSRALANTPHQVVCPPRGNCRDRQSTLHSGAAIWRPAALFHLSHIAARLQRCKICSGGHIDLMFVSPDVSLPHVRDGTIKAYAATARSRLPAQLRPKSRQQTRRCCQASISLCGTVYGRGSMVSRECHCGSLRTPKYLESVLHRAEVRVVPSKLVSSGEPLPRCGDGYARRVRKVVPETCKRYSGA